MNLTPPHDGPTTAVLDAVERLYRRLLRMTVPHRHAGVQVSASEVMALADLACRPLSQTDLGEQLGLEKSTVSRLVSGLERRGWVLRERVPDDRRFVELHLTGRGREVAALVTAEVLAHHRRVLSGLSAEELTALATGLAALEREVAAAGPPSLTPPRDATPPPRPPSPRPR